MDQSKLSKLIDKQLVPNSRQVKSAGEYAGANRGNICDGLLDWLPKSSLSIKYETYSTSTIRENRKKITHATRLSCIIPELLEQFEHSPDILAIFHGKNVDKTFFVIFLPIKRGLSPLTCNSSV